MSFRKRASVALLTLGLTTASVTSAEAQTPAALVPANETTISGRILDRRGVAVVGAVITASGTTTGWTATIAEGRYTLRVPPGSDDLLVRKGPQEVNRLHGTTVTLIHPVGDSTLNLSYDYRSDGTTVASGDPTAPFVSGAPISSLGGYQVTIPTTLARNFDWSATYAVPLTSRLRLFVGDYYTDWKLSYGITSTTLNYTTSTAARSTQMADRTYRHDDPHAGLTWRPERNTNYRFTVGSAVTVP